MPLTADEICRDPLRRFPEATVAAFDPTRGVLPRRRLDEERTRTLLARYAQAGVPGVLVASSTGQGHGRSPGELAQWFDCAAGAELGAMLPMALLRPEDGVDTNRLLMDRCAAAGYPVVFLRPGTDLPEAADDETVRVTLAPLVAAAAQRGLAVGLYSISDVSGVALTPSVAAGLRTGEGGDRIVAIKVTEVDYEQSTARFLAHPALADIKIVQGWDPHLVRALRAGAPENEDGPWRVGVTSGLMGLAWEQYQYLLAAAGRGEWQRAQDALDAAGALFRAMQDDPDHFADLQRAKYLMGLGHPLTGTVAEEQIEPILEALARLPDAGDRARLARSLDLMGDGPRHQQLADLG